MQCVAFASGEAVDTRAIISTDMLTGHCMQTALLGGALIRHVFASLIASLKACVCKLVCKLDRQSVVMPYCRVFCPGFCTGFCRSSVGCLAALAWSFGSHCTTTVVQ